MIRLTGNVRWETMWHGPCPTFIKRSPHRRFVQFSLTKIAPTSFVWYHFWVSHCYFGVWHFCFQFFSYSKRLISVLGFIFWFYLEEWIRFLVPRTNKRSGSHIWIRAYTYLMRVYEWWLDFLTFIRSFTIFLL